MEPIANLVELARKRDELVERLREAEQRTAELRAEVRQAETRILETLGMTPERRPPDEPSVSRVGSVPMEQVARKSAERTSDAPSRVPARRSMAGAAEQGPPDLKDAGGDEARGGHLAPPSQPPAPKPTTITSVDSGTDAARFLTQTSKKGFQRIQLIRRALDDVGGAARRGVLLEQVQRYDPTVTLNKLVYSLRQYDAFTRDSKNRWMYLSKETDLSSQQQRRWARTNMLRRGIEEAGGKARWTALLAYGQQSEGESFSRNNLNYTLRNGPFHKTPSGEYVWVGGDVKVEVMHDGAWWPLVRQEPANRNSIVNLTLQRRDGSHFHVEMHHANLAERIRHLPADAEFELK